MCHCVAHHSFTYWLVVSIFMTVLFIVGVIVIFGRDDDYSWENRKSRLRAEKDRKQLENKPNK